MTIDELQKLARFAGLSAQQKLYTVAICLGKDKIDAGKEAWKCANDASALSSANRAERNGNVRWLIDEFRGGNLPTKDQYIKLVWNTALSCSDYKNKLKALELVARASGFEVRAADPESVQKRSKSVWDEVADLEDDTDSTGTSSTEEEG